MSSNVRGAMRTTDDQKRAFGARLRAARKERFGTIQKMADHLTALGVLPSPSVPKLSAWERGDYVPSEWWMVEHLEQVLGVGDELATLEARLVELAEAWADGDIDRRSWVTARRRIDARVEELRRSLGAGPLPVGDVREAWAAMDVDRRRALVALVVDRVVVGPAVRGRNVFDPGRVSIDWR